MSALRRPVALLGVALGAGTVLATVGVIALSVVGERKLQAPDTPAPKVTTSRDPAVLERGRALVFGAAHCSHCHGVPDRNHPDRILADGPLAGGKAFDLGYRGTVHASNLTPDRETGIGQRTDEELARTITTGVLANGSISPHMRYRAARLSQQDLVAVLSWLRAQKPARHAVPPGKWSAVGLALLGLSPVDADVAPLPAHVEAGAQPSALRGAYLATHVCRCTSCHTAAGLLGMQPTGPLAGGGVPEADSANPDMEFVAPNLTAHATGVTGRLDENAFVARMRQGGMPVSSPMPWADFGRMTEGDLRSIYRHLRSLPPVDRDVGPGHRKAGWKPAG